MGFMLEVPNLLISILINCLMYFGFSKCKVILTYLLHGAESFLKS